jgi:threonine dehydrogenase-like Zn-dependent dehydrogenase
MVGIARVGGTTPVLTPSESPSTSPSRQTFAQSLEGATAIKAFVLERKRVDPTLMTTHSFRFDEMERACELADKKLDDAVKVTDPV